MTKNDPTHAKVVLYKTKKEVQQKPRKYHVISFLSVNNSHTLALLNHVVKNAPFGILKVTASFSTPFSLNVLIVLNDA